MKRKKSKRDVPLQKDAASGSLFGKGQTSGQVFTYRSRFVRKPRRTQTHSILYSYYIIS